MPMTSKGIQSLADTLRCTPRQLIRVIRELLEDRYTGAEGTAEFNVTIEDDVLKIRTQMPGLHQPQWPEVYSLRLPTSGLGEVSLIICGTADAASAVWRMTHGCCDCGPADKNGNRAVNWKCRSCHGEGTIH